MTRILSRIININEDDGIPPKDDGAVRVIVFSDIHLGIFPQSPLRLLSKRFLGSFNHLLNRRHRLHSNNIAKLASQIPTLKPDAVLCAGDLTSVALPEEFALASHALQPIIDAAPIFLYVPGNHDAYVNSTDARQALELTFQHLNANRWKLAQLPQQFDMPGLAIVLANPARPVGPLLSCGIIDRQQADALNRLFATRTNSPRALLCHFPALTADAGTTGWRHGLRGATTLIGALENRRIDTILSGHVHTPYITTLPNDTQQICAGSLTLHNSCAIVDFLP